MPTITKKQMEEYEQLLTETEATQILQKRMEKLEPSAGFRLCFFE